MGSINNLIFVLMIFFLSGCASFPQDTIDTGKEPESAIESKSAVSKSDFDGGNAYVLSNDILFDFGESTIRSQSENKMESLIADIKAKKGKVIITGHTDSTGNEDNNLRLSINRAENIAAILERNGVAASRIITKGLGESKPFADNSSAESRQRNRRVEVIAYTKEGTEYAAQGGDNNAAVALAVAAGASILKGAGEFVSWLFGGGSGGSSSSSHSNNSYIITNTVRISSSNVEYYLGCSDGNPVIVTHNTEVGTYFGANRSMHSSLDAAANSKGCY